MKRHTRHIFGKAVLSSVLLTATLLIQLGVDGQARTYDEPDATIQNVPFAVTLTASFVPSSNLITSRTEFSRHLGSQSLGVTKKYQRLESIKDKKQLGLTLFFLGMVGEKV